MSDEFFEAFAIAGFQWDAPTTVGAENEVLARGATSRETKWITASSGITVGTTVVSGGTQGSVLFVGALSVVQQDNTNLFWDDTANQLRIGPLTNPLGSKLEIKTATLTEGAIVITPFADNGAIVFAILNSSGGSYVFMVNTAGAINQIGNSGSTWNGGMVVSTSGVRLIDVGYVSLNVTITPFSAAFVPLIVKGSASQTADLQQWQNSSSTILSCVSPVGSIAVGSSTFPSGGGTPIVLIGNAGSDPTGVPTNCAAVYSKDGELWAVDAAGNASIQTPHPLDAPPTMYDDMPGREDFQKTIQQYRGRIYWRNVSRLAKLAMLTPAQRAALTAAQRVYEFDETFSQYNTRVVGANLVKQNWDAHQQEQATRRSQEQAKWDSEKSQLDAQHAEWLKRMRHRALLPRWKQGQVIPKPPNIMTPRPETYTPQPAPAAIGA